MTTIKRLRWWHAAVFCAVLLLVIATLSHALRTPAASTADGTETERTKIMTNVRGHS